VRCHVFSVSLIQIAHLVVYRFRIKEVLPIEKSVFWSDLGIARKVYQKRAVLERAQVAISTASETVDGACTEEAPRDEGGRESQEAAVDDP